MRFPGHLSYCGMRDKPLATLASDQTVACLSVHDLLATAARPPAARARDAIQAPPIEATYDRPVTQDTDRLDWIATGLKFVHDGRLEQCASVARPVSPCRNRQDRLAEYPADQLRGGC